MRDVQGELDRAVHELGALTANYHAAAARVHARIAQLTEELTVMRLQVAEARLATKEEAES